MLNVIVKQEGEMYDRVFRTKSCYGIMKNDGIRTLVSHAQNSYYGGIIVGRTQHKPNYCTVHWYRKVEQTGWRIAGWSAVLSLLSQLSHLSYEDRVAKVRCNTMFIVILVSLTGGLASQWTFLQHNTELLLPPPYYYASMSVI